MASLDWELTRRDGVTLVELVVTAEAEEWIRVDSRLEPVWPPRRQGVPAAGWDGTGFEGRVGPDDPLVLGYASPAAPVEPPARLEAPAPDGSPPDDGAVSARALVRTLGESAPPRDVVPAESPGDGPPGPGDRGGPDQTSGSAPPSPPAGGSTPRGGSPAAASPDSQTAAATGSPAAVAPGSRTAGAAGASPLVAAAPPDGGARSRDAHDSGSRQPNAAATADADPAAIEPWFDQVETRTAEAERLAEVTGADEAREAVETAGGIDAVRGLREQLETDRQRLRELRERQRQLADRLAAVEIPLSTLERVT